MRLKAALLVVVMVVSASAGAWLLVSPSIEKQAALGRQNELLSELETPLITDSPKMKVDKVIPFYVPAISNEPEVTDAPATETPASEPTPIAVPSSKPTPIQPPFIPPQDPFEAIGTMEIEKISLKLPVVYGITKEQLKIAPGLIPQTVPIGAIGNAVIAGHRNYDYGSMFNRLDEVEVDDMILYTPKGGETMRFVVFEVSVIEPGDQTAFIQPQDESIITLYTCTPVRKATHRLIVRARVIADN